MEKVSMQIRMPLQLKEKLEHLSRQKGLTINAIIIENLWNKVNEKINEIK